MYSSISLVTPPVIEPVAITVVRKHLRVDHTDEDDLLTIYANTARVLAEHYLDRALITQTLQWTMADAPIYGQPFAGLPAPLQVLPLSYSWANIQRRPVELPRSPVQSVISVSTLDVHGTATLLTSGYDALVGSDPGRIRFSGGSPGGLQPGGGLQVTYIAGYGTPDAVPMPIRHGILLLAAWLYENRGDAETEWPMVVYRLLDPWRVVTFGG